jgi:alkanesulfonate monooxygenase SsuD/methylene tetrahydromethanopterin reductase-like flavin-dependent oxidoreductase (luciferase family)
MRVDLLLNTFGTRWSELLDAAMAAEQAGLDGVWLNDHLAGSIEGASGVLECWTSLSALAAAVPRIAVGPLVLNVANRDPGTLAVMAATLQEVSGGRLFLGLGAGAQRGTAYALEQDALGRPTGNDLERRRIVERTITILRQVWSGAVPPVAGFLRPAPPPPIVVAALGPKMAQIAGQSADGICVPLGSAAAELVAVARRAHARSERDPSGFLVIATLGSELGSTPASEVEGVDRLVVYAARPFDEAVARAAECRNHWPQSGFQTVRDFHPGHPA